MCPAPVVSSMMLCLHNNCPALAAFTSDTGPVRPSYFISFSIFFSPHLQCSELDNYPGDLITPHIPWCWHWPGNGHHGPSNSGLSAGIIAKRSAVFDPTPGDLFVQAGSFNAEIISGPCERVTSYIKQLISSRANEARSGDSGDLTLHCTMVKSRQGEKHFMWF